MDSSGVALYWLSRDGATPPAAWRRFARALPPKDQSPAGASAAFLIASVAETPTACSDIRARLKSSLADYKVPKHFEIHRALPREDSGKIFKRRLRDPYWERAGRRI